MTQKELLICLTNNPLKGSSKKEMSRKCYSDLKVGAKKNINFWKKKFKIQPPRTHLLVTLISLITEVISAYLEKKACYR